MRYEALTMIVRLEEYTGRAVKTIAQQVAENGLDQIARRYNVPASLVQNAIEAMDKLTTA
jgi:hypothetical protein